MRVAMRAMSGVGWAAYARASRRRRAASMRIDAHQHFWQLARGDYDWLTADLATLYRDFLPSDLAPLLRRHGIDGTVVVPASPLRARAIGG